MALATCCGVLLVGCGGGSDSNNERTTTEPDDMPTVAADLAASQRAAINTAIGRARTAVDAVNNDATDAQVTAADTAIANLGSVITVAVNIPDDEKNAHTSTLNLLKDQLKAAKSDRQRQMNEEMNRANMKIMEMARKLYHGIGPDPSVVAATAIYLSNDIIRLTEPRNGIDVDLTEDKKTMVTDLYGWKGKRYMASPVAGVGMYEAHVYSNIETTEGKKFGHAGFLNDDFEYQLTNGMITVTTDDPAAQAKVASPRFDQGAGKKEFELPDNKIAVKISGSYHGVSGEYSCVPGQDQACSATVAAMGFTLEGGDWTFKPNDPNARVTDTPSNDYATYGWWLHKSADSNTWTASAFSPATQDPFSIQASGITALAGTATYVGGAAGKYALHSTTGGTNDAGHFTARATLEADFNADMITGTIDNLIGPDDKSRNWSVELKKSGISDDGVVGIVDEYGVPIGHEKTIWKIGDTAAAESGRWDGAFWNNGDDGVPKIVNGTFFSTYNNDGRMVGAFGTNKQ